METTRREDDVQAMLADLDMDLDHTPDALTSETPGGSASVSPNSASSKTDRLSPRDVAAEAEAATKRAQDEKNAEILDDQRRVARMLLIYWKTLGWPEGDKTEDQLPDDYCPPAADTTALHCKESKVESKTGSKRSSSHVTDEPTAKVARRSGRLATARGSRGSGLS